MLHVCNIATSLHCTAFTVPSLCAAGVADRKLLCTLTDIVAQRCSNVMLCCLQVVTQLDSQSVSNGDGEPGSPVFSSAQAAELQLAAAWQVCYSTLPCSCPQPCPNLLYYMLQGCCSACWGKAMISAPRYPPTANAGCDCCHTCFGS